MKNFITPFNFSFWRSNLEKSAAFQIKPETAGKLINALATETLFKCDNILVMQHTENAEKTVLQ